MSQITVCLCWLIVATARAADVARAHINQGIKTPFPASKPVVALTSEEEATLLAGGTIKRQDVAASGKGGRAMAVQDVGGTPEVVWGRILDFRSYPKMVNGVAECSSYEEYKVALPRPRRCTLGAIFRP
jgi:hypothetical protein